MRKFLKNYGSADGSQDIWDFLLIFFKGSPSWSIAWSGYHHPFSLTFSLQDLNPFSFAGVNHLNFEYYYFMTRETRLIEYI
jgi:hypothetical protein